jgi:hypothetical protein
VPLTKRCSRIPRPWHSADVTEWCCPPAPCSPFSKQRECRF